MPLDFPLAPIVNGEPYNAKNRKDPKEKAARSDINAGKRSSLFEPRSELVSVDSIKRDSVPSTKKTLEERIRPSRRRSILSRSLVE